MGWLSVILAGFSGALSATIAYLFVRNPKERRVAYASLFVLCFAVLYVFSRVFVLPYIHEWQFEHKIERHLQEIPAYREIKSSDPETYARIRTIVRDGTREGDRTDLVAGRIRVVINELVTQRIPQASDDSVIDFATVMVREIEELTRLSPTLCYQYLFPEKYGALDLSQHIGDTILQNDLAALASLIRTASHNPQPVPDASKSEALLQQVYGKLYEAFGDDVLLLKNPHDPSVNKEKVCTVIAAVYKQVLEMPKNDSGMVLRYMFSRQ